MDDRSATGGRGGHPCWGEHAQLDPLAAVLDPADRLGGKNRVIDRVHRRALRRALPDLAGRRVLDFGCGTGRLTSWLVSRGADVDAVDVTREMLEVAQRRVDGARFHLIEDERLPFGDASFDVVVTAYVLQYYVRSDPGTLKEPARVLRDGGALVAIEQVTNDEARSEGASIDCYESMFEDSGLTIVQRSVLRNRDSRILGTVLRHPALSRLPALPRLLEREARLRPPELTNGRYADVALCAIKRRSPSYEGRP